MNLWIGGSFGNALIRWARAIKPFPDDTVTGFLYQEKRFSSFHLQKKKKKKVNSFYKSTQ